MRLIIITLTCFVVIQPAYTQQKQTFKGQFFDSPFYPLRPGSYWLYRATMADKSIHEVRVAVDGYEDFDHKSLQDKKEVLTKIVRTRLKITSGDKEQTEIVAVFEDGVYRYATAGKDIAPPLRFFKLPLSVGDSWKVSSTSENAAMKGEFVCRKDEVVDTPAGRFQAKVVSCPSFQAGAETIALEYWFAGNEEVPVGMVKHRVRIGSNEIMLELKDYKIGPEWKKSQLP